VDSQAMLRAMASPRSRVSCSRDSLWRRATKVTVTVTSPMTTGRTSGDGPVGPTRLPAAACRIGVDRHRRAPESEFFHGQSRYSQWIDLEPGDLFRSLTKSTSGTGHERRRLTTRRPRLDTPGSARRSPWSHAPRPEASPPSRPRTGSSCALRVEEGSKEGVGLRHVGDPGEPEHLACRLVMRPSSAVQRRASSESDSSFGERLNHQGVDLGRPASRLICRASGRQRHLSVPGLASAAREARTSCV
jgi:hypothetical protein